MTRALAIALLSASTLAVIAVGFLVFQKPAAVRRQEIEEPRRPQPAPRVRVLAGQTADRAVVLKPRFADRAQAEFTDRALAERIGADPGAWRFVEVWVVNRGAADVTSLAATPGVALAGGTRAELKPLRELGPKGRGPAAEMHVRDLAPDSALPLRKGSFRRTVYALANAVRFDQIVSAEVDGIPLVPCETTEEALEGFIERPRADLIAALSKTEDTPVSRARTDRMEESR